MIAIKLKPTRHEQIGTATSVLHFGDVAIRVPAEHATEAHALALSGAEVEMRIGAVGALNEETLLWERVAELNRGTRALELAGFRLSGEEETGDGIARMSVALKAALAEIDAVKEDIANVVKSRDAAVANLVAPAQHGSATPTEFESREALVSDPESLSAGQLNRAVRTLREENYRQRVRAHEAELEVRSLRARIAELENESASCTLLHGDAPEVDKDTPCELVSWDPMAIGKAATGLQCNKTGEHAACDYTIPLRICADWNCDNAVPDGTETCAKHAPKSSPSEAFAALFKGEPIVGPSNLGAHDTEHGSMVDGCGECSVNGPSCPAQPPASTTTWPQAPVLGLVGDPAIAQVEPLAVQHEQPLPDNGRIIAPKAKTSPKIQLPRCQGINKAAGIACTADGTIERAGKLYCGKHDPEKPGKQPHLALAPVLAEQP